MSYIMFTDNDKTPILRQPEQPEFFDLLTIEQQAAKKLSQNSQVISLEPMELKLSVKLYCCVCPEDECCHKKKCESDKCGKSDECKDGECCSSDPVTCSMETLYNTLCCKKTNKDAPVKEENTAENP